MSKTASGDNIEDKKRVFTEVVKCKNCGGNMVFDPDKQKLYCPHCESTLDIKSEGEAKELDINIGFDDTRKWGEDEATVFRCDNCGAKVVLSNGETAKICPFCGTAHVSKTEELNGIKPNGVLPFLFGVEKATEYAKSWALKKLYAPKKFKKGLKEDNIHGVYAPCFTFDSATTSVYEGEIGETHTRTVGSGKDKRVETYTVWKRIRGTYCYGFDDILVSAGEKINQKKVDKLSPYETNSSRDYEGKYLLGYMAYQYDTEMSDCWGYAKNCMDKRIRRGILSQYVYDKVAYLNVSTKHENVTFKYVMLPVYVGNFNYNKKVYNFYVNGTTGKIFGKTPVSFAKILITVLSVIGIAVVGALVAKLNGGI